MGFTNPEQSAVALSCMAIIWFVSDKDKLKKVALAVLSMILSAGVIRSILDDPDVAGRLDYYTERGGLAGLIEIGRLLDYFPHFFAGAWVIIAVTMFAAWKTRSFPGIFAISLAVIAIPSASFLITTDGGRNFATVMAPPALVALTRFLPQISKKLVLLVLGLAIGLQFTYNVNDLDDFEPRWPTMSENLDSRPQPLD